MSESTLVKMPHCWKSHVTAHLPMFSVFVTNKVKKKWEEHFGRFWSFLIFEYGKLFKISNIFFFLFSNKMLVFRVGFHKFLVRIAKQGRP